MQVQEQEPLVSKERPPGAVEHHRGVAALQPKAAPGTRHQGTGRPAGKVRTSWKARCISTPLLLAAAYGEMCLGYVLRPTREMCLGYVLRPSQKDPGVVGLWRTPRAP